MKISITYHPSASSPAAAAFIRGEYPHIWLQEISRWDMPVEESECYILPVSMQSVKPAGLFVIFKNASRFTHLELLEPYYCLQGKLYIPLQTQLKPQVSNEELKKLLIWEKQVLHPSIGFVGFEAKDRIGLTSLFLYNNAQEADWSFAHTGIADRPPFHLIQLEQPTAEELMEEIKKQIGQKPLEEIPKEPGDEPGVLGKIGDWLKYGIFSGIYSLATILGKIIPEGSSNPNARSQKGLLQQLQNWIERNMEEIQRRRNSELNRLMKMFDENNPDALQYAIPLDSPYLNRGSAANPGSQLTRRPTDFNLRNLGGGQAVDYWDMSNYYHDLRTKYLNAAQKEIEQNNFKKAAYIYAHLLGDYPSAAKVLEQGKMYREAAALHKDHLKNERAAAECLERGGLYHEAIDLYTHLGMDEKTGDLYKKLKQDEKASFFYEKYINTKLTNSDFLDAGRVLRQKLNDTERAKTTLLHGWNHSHQSEPCLKEYFDIVLKDEEQHAGNKIKEVYSKHTPKHKRMPFLNVLETMHEKNQDEELKSTLQDLAYEIVHKEADENNVSALHALKRFIPEDKLIGSDASRYAAINRTRPAPRSSPAKTFYLDETIKWISAAWHGNQFLVVGIKNGVLHMARGNWYVNLEYYSWENWVEPYTRYTFIESPLSSQVILHCSHGSAVTRKNLPRNKYFNEALVVDCPAWLHADGGQCIIIDEDKMCRLDIKDRSMTLHHYSMEGKLLKSINCKFAGGEQPIGEVASHPSIAYRQGNYYSYKDKYLFCISDNGEAVASKFHTVIRFFATSRNFPVFFIVASSNAGLLLFQPEGGDLCQISDFFSEDLIPLHIVFVENYKFVVAEKKKAYVFEIVNNQRRITQVYETQNNIIGVLHTSVRGHFALVEENGKVAMYEC